MIFFALGNGWAETPINEKILSIKNTQNFSTSQWWKPFDKFHKTKNPDYYIRVLYSERDLNPHAHTGTGF